MNLRSGFVECLMVSADDMVAEWLLSVVQTQS